MKTSEVLNRAADLIEERGWTKGQGWPGQPDGPEDGSLCLEGGIMAALGIDYGDYSKMTSCSAYVAVRDYLDWQPKIGQTCLFQWNDKRDRTAAEVIEVLRATAVIEAAREDAEAELEGWRDLYPQLTAVAVAKAVDDARARILGDRPEPVEREVAVS